MTVALSAFLIHAQTLSFGFTNWDDDINVTLNPYVTPPSWAGVAHHWCNAYRSLYVPLVYTAFALDGLVGGGEPWAFHLSNVLLHAAAAVAVVLIVNRLMAPNPAAKPGSPYLWVVAAGAGLIFAWHPLQVEPVSWITGRKDVLSGCLALWAVWFYLRSAADAPKPDLRRWSSFASVSYGGAFLLFCLSLTAKPSVVALPAGLLAIEWCLRPASVRRAAMRLAPWFAVAAGWAILTAASPLWKRPLIAADAVWFYLKTLAWPVNLAPVYGRTPDLVTANLWTVLGAMALILTVAAALIKRGPLSAAGLFALVMLMPVLGLTPFLFQNFSTVADRYLYVSMLGVALAVGTGLAPVMRLSRRGRMFVGALAAAVLALLAGLSVRQARIWRDSFALWEHNIRLYPQAAAAYHNLANAHVLAGRDEAAYPLFEQALALDPDFGESQNNLGLIEGRRGNHEQAVSRYNAALAAYERLNLRDTRVFEAQVNMAASLLALRRLDEAESQLRAALDRHPDSWQALTNMGLVLAAKGDPAGARHYLEKALEYSPGNPKITAELQRLTASRSGP
jgi:tetratricopeptide (TPR) repeat protein